VLEEELCNFCDLIFHIPTKFEALEFLLRGCRVGDQSLFPMVTQGISKLTHLKRLCLDLSSTHVGNKSIEALGDIALPSIKALEHLELNLASTMTTDVGIMQLFLRDMTTIRSVILNFNCTKITDKSIQALAMYCLPSMQNLGHFELHLDSTEVTDQSVALLFVKEMPFIKSFILDLALTQVSDKSIEAFMTNSLPSMKAMEHLELHLTVTRVTDQSISLLLSKDMSNMRSIILELSNTEISDKKYTKFRT